MNTQLVSLKDLVPDPNNPRKNFDPIPMNSLRESIDTEGINSPLIVEKYGDKFLILDGERRFRAATELKMKEVPVSIVAPRSAIERLVLQFHIQEQHESWDPVEKANAIFEISKELKLTTKDICKLLSVSSSTAKRYLAFANITDKKSYMKSEIPLDYADSIVRIVGSARRITENELGDDFDSRSAKDLEAAIIQRIRTGIIMKKYDLTKIGDSFTKDPKSIKEFVETDISPTQLFKKYHADGYFHLRNIRNSCRGIVSHAAQLLETKDAKIGEEEEKLMKSSIKVLRQVLSVAGLE